MKNLKDCLIKEGFLRKNLGLGKEELIRKWLDEHKITDYKINPDLTIDVKGSVWLRNYDGEELPEYINFGWVDYTFSIKDSKIKSLRGFPRACTTLDIMGCKDLNNLTGSVIEPVASLILYDCPKITSLCGDIQNYKSLRVRNCGIKNLEGIPNKINDIVLIECENLETLKGAPKQCHSIEIQKCPSLKSIEHGPHYVYSFQCMYCPELKSLEGLKSVTYRLIAIGCGKVFTNAYFDKLGISTARDFYFFNKIRKNGMMYNG